MTNIELIAAMRARRVPFHIARRLLAAAGLPRGLTWDSIIAKMVEDGTENDSSDELEDLYRQSVTSGEKLATIYPLTTAAMTAVRRELGNSILDAEDPAVAAYPLLLNAAQKLDAIHQNPVLVSVEDHGQAKAYVFSKVRVKVTTEPIVGDILPVGISGRYAEVYGRLEEHVQHFDVVLVPDAGEAVFVLTDNVEMTGSERVAAQSTTRTAFNQLVRFNALQQRTNLFPAIEWLYTNTDGRVISLGSMTNTAMEKRERTHDRTMCVRRDPGHEAASNAGVAISPFGISVEWVIGSSTNHSVTPSLEISGTSRLALDANPVIEDVAFHKCATYGEISFLINKLMEALTPPNANDQG